MNLRLYIICIAAVLALVVPAAAADNSTAKVYGGVYSSDTFEPLDNAVVYINSTPSQSMVAKSGIYSFELDPGNYSITAKYYQNSTLTYSATEDITITKGGSYRLDLLLLPVYSEELMEGSAVNLSSENSTSSAGNKGTVVAVNKTNASNTVNAEQTRIYSSTVNYLLIALALFLLLAAGYSLYKKHKKISKNKPLKEKIDHITQDSVRAENLPELKVETHKTIDLEQGQGFNASTEEMESATEPAEPESRIPVKEPETETEPITPLIKPVVESESKLPAVGEAVELESRVLEKKTSAENKEEDKEEDKGKNTEEYKGNNKEEDKGNNKEENKGNNREEDKGKNTEEYKEEDKGNNKEEYPVQEAEIPESGSEEEKNDYFKDLADNSENEISASKKKLPLPADLQEIMDIIRGHGGRITQKDLRSRLKYSEGKVSLMLADLERRDLIEKFKRGRGNVVILKDEEL